MRSKNDLMTIRICIGVWLDELSKTPMIKQDAASRLADLMGDDSITGARYYINALIIVGWLIEENGHEHKNVIVRPSDYGLRMSVLILERL